MRTKKANEKCPSSVLLSGGKSRALERLLQADCGPSCGIRSKPYLPVDMHTPETHTDFYVRPKTRQDATALTLNSHRDFRALLEARMAELKPSSLMTKRFETLIGDRANPGELRLSDLVAHQELSRLLADEVQSLARANPALRFFHITALSDLGVASDRKPYAAVDELKRKADKAIRAIECDGIAVVELQGLLNWPQEGDGRTLLFHDHLLVWTTDSTVTASTIREKLSAGHVWSCKFDAEPVEVREITTERGCPSYWAAYLTKAPSEAKTRLPRRSKKGARACTTSPPRFWLRSTSAGYRPEFAMRIWEYAAQMPLFGPFVGVGAGAAVLSTCRSRMTAWQKARTYQKPPLKNLAFARFRRWTHKNRRKHYSDYDINTRTLS